MRSAGDDAHGRRLRGLIVVMWRAGLRVQEALALTEGDLDQRRGSLLIRRGKGGRRREVGMDAWGWDLQPCSSGRHFPAWRREPSLGLNEAKAAVLSPEVEPPTQEWGQFRTVNWTLNAKAASNAS
jgi:integrase